MDFLRDLGPLAMASRLKRLTERLYRSGEQVYSGRRVEFEPRWFMVVARLREAAGGSVPITVLARDLGVTHPAVIKLVREMEQRGLVASASDPSDGRRRLVGLTARGSELIAEVEPIWAAFEEATRRLFDEIDCDLIAVIDRLESALDAEDLSFRVAAASAVGRPAGSSSTRGSGTRPVDRERREEDDI